MAFSLSAFVGGRTCATSVPRASTFFASLAESNRAGRLVGAMPPRRRLGSRTSDAAPRRSGDGGFQRRRHSFDAARPARRGISMLKSGQRIAVDHSGGGGGSDDRKKAKNPPHAATAPRPFVDRARLRARGGRGGAGSLSYHSIGSYKRRACGGHGGTGGNVYLVTDPTLSSLKMEKNHFSGEDGTRGGNNGRNGRKGRDVHVRVPCGVVVRRVLDYGEEAEGDDLLDEDDGADDEDKEEGGEESTTYERPEEASSRSDTEEDVEGDVGEITDGEEEDFDLHYERMRSSKRGRRRGGSAGGLPSDYDDAVDTGTRAEDGMYHWSAPESTDDEELLAATAYPDRGDWHGSSALARRSVFLADLDRPHSSLLVAEGGRAGVGNQAYANRPHTSGISAHMARKAVPTEGEVSHLELELKLIADVGLVGFPNAGKSSLLSAMSRARPKIASYPFTTLHPLVGSVQYRDGYKVVVADIPGLIDGAAEGRGRGIEFLRHIERTKALAYVVDGAGTEGRDPAEDLRVLGRELREYGSSGIFGDDEIDGHGDGEREEETRRRRREMLGRPSLILANKMDLIPEDDAGMGRREELLFRLGLAAEEVGIAVCETDGILGMSAGVTGEGLRAISRRLRRAVEDAEGR